MPKYTVRSGTMKQIVETHPHASPQSIAVMAIMISRENNLGVLTEISGGKYIGDNVTYVSTVKVLEDMGVIPARLMINAG